MTVDKGMRVADRYVLNVARENTSGEARLYCMKDVRLELQVLKLVYAVRDAIIYDCRWLTELLAPDLVLRRVLPTLLQMRPPCCR